MDVQDRVLAFLRTTGPTTPTKVAKSINTDILLASAHLSDLAAQSKVKISALKIGSSPLYYLPGQEEQLYRFAAGNLHPKDFQVLEKLKQEKVLRETNLDLLAKVSLRSLKDFAVPLQVSTTERKELFWKWHLLPEEETKSLIAQAISPRTKETAPPPAEESIKEKEALAPLPQKEIPSPEKEPALREAKKEEPIKEKYRKKPDYFLPQIDRFFVRLKIEMETKETVRKNSEINFLVRVPSVVGKITYFCKAKNKTRCDEKDLSAAYMEAQVKKLPLLFLYTSELNNKAREMLESGALENAIVRKVDI